MSEPRKLYRNPGDAWIAGVGSGLAEYLNVDRTAIRAAIALLIVFTGVFPGVIAYVVMWLIVPPKPPLGMTSVPLPPLQP